MEMKQKGKKPTGSMTRAAVCTYNGVAYTEGARTCQGDDTYECQSDGTWKMVRISC